MKPQRNNTQKPINLAPGKPVATQPISTNAVNRPRSRSNPIPTVALDEEKQRLLELFLKNYQILRHKEYFSMFRSNFVSQLTEKKPAEQYKMIKQHARDKANSRTAKAWQLTKKQYSERWWDRLLKQIPAFERIYQALYTGQSGVKTKNFVDTQFIGKHLSYEEAYDLIQQHLLQKPKSRIAYAWALAKQYYDNCNSNNIALLKSIYQYSFAHSLLGSKAQVGGQIFDSSAKLKSYLDDADKPDHLSQFRYKVWEIKSTPNQAPHTRLACIISALDKSYSYPIIQHQLRSSITP